MKAVIFTSLFLFIVVTAGNVCAQDSPKTISGGILNGKAISLPKPAYPEEAKKDNASASVPVTVLIDEEGNVIEAAAAEEYKAAPRSAGEEAVMKPIHPALREAAEQAAKMAKFAPTKLSGVPVKVSGTIVYNFITGSGERAVGSARMVRGGVINGKALRLPAPVYPAAAKAAGAEGPVSVQVTIDEGGNVISAAAVSGHALLRAAAVEAAKEAQFSVTMLAGQPVQVSGILTYNFVLAKEN